MTPSLKSYQVAQVIKYMWSWTKFWLVTLVTSQIIYGFVQKADFEGWSWFNVNNLGLALGMALKFYSSVAKRLKLKVKKCWGKLVGTFCTFPLFPSWIGLKTIWQNPVFRKLLKRRSIGFIASLPAVWK